MGSVAYFITQLAFFYHSFIPLIVLAFWGIYMLPTSTFYGNQTQPLKKSKFWQIPSLPGLAPSWGEGSMFDWYVFFLGVQLATSKNHGWPWKPSSSWTKKNQTRSVLWQISGNVQQVREQVRHWCPCLKIWAVTIDASEMCSQSEKMRVSKAWEQPSSCKLQIYSDFFHDLIGKHLFEQHHVKWDTNLSNTGRPKAPFFIRRL